MRGEDRCQVPIEDLTATSLRMPLDLAYIGSSLIKEGVEVRIKDYPAEKGTIEAFIQDLNNFSPQLLLVSSTLFSLYKDLEILKITKSKYPEIFTVIKGVTASRWKKYLLESNNSLDFILSGEYELTLPKLIKGKPLESIAGVSFRKNGEIILSKEEPSIEDLDLLPYPARHLLRNELYIRSDTGEPMTTIQVGRGCPFSCIYCLASQVSGKRLRLRSPVNIIDEIEECVKVYGINNFFFRADTFTMQKKWVLEITREIEERDFKIQYAVNSRVDTIDEEMVKALKRSGCFLISLGVESGNKESLNLIKKGTTLEQGEESVYLLKKYGIKSYLFFMIGFPWEDKKDIEETVKYAIKLNGDFAEFHIPVPFEETPLRKMMEEEGLIPRFIPPEKGASLSTHGLPSIGTKYITAYELRKIRKKSILRYYLRFNYIYGTLIKTRSIKEFFNYIRYGYNRVIRLMFSR